MAPFAKGRRGWGGGGFVRRGWGGGGWGRGTEALSVEAGVAEAGAGVVGGLMAMVTGVVAHTVIGGPTAGAVFPSMATDTAVRIRCAGRELWCSVAGAAVGGGW